MHRAFRTLIFAYFLAALAGWGVSCGARACAQDPVAMEHEGTPGVWLPVDLARDALAAYTAVPHLQDEVRILRDALAIRDSQIAQYREADDRGVRARALLVTSVREAVQARESAQAPWRHPILWLAVGAVVGVLAGVWVF